MSKRTVLVFRHAKTEPSGGNIDDFERRLTAEGRLAAGRMGVRCASLGFTIDRVVSSPAVRAKETTELFLKAYSPNRAIDVEYIEKFYAADGTDLATWWRKNAGGAAWLLVGHNPSLEELVSELTKRPAKLKPADMAAITLGSDGFESLCFYRP